jgi:hypothetical protein
LAQQVLAQTRKHGVDLVDPSWLLNQPTTQVLEAAMEAEVILAPKISIHDLHQHQSSAAEIAASAPRPELTTGADLTTEPLVAAREALTHVLPDVPVVDHREDGSEGPVVGDQLLMHSEDVQRPSSGHPMGQRGYCASPICAS